MPHICMDEVIAAIMAFPYIGHACNCIRCWIARLFT